MAANRFNLLQAIINQLVHFHSPNLLTRTSRQLVHFETNRIKNLTINKDFILSHRGEPVSKMSIIMPQTLITKSEDGSLAFRYDLEDCQVIITTSHKVEVYALPSTYYATVATNLNEIIFAYNGLIEQTYCYLGKPSFASNPFNYSDEIHAFYCHARALVAESVLNEFRQAGTPSSLRIVSLGSGTGHELIECKRLIDAKNPGIDIKLIGFDHCKPLVIQANKEIKASGESCIKFFEADCKTLRTFLTTRAQFNVGIAVGFLTREVLTGTCEALPLFQKVYREFDSFIITGITAPLITLDMANAIGWAPCLRNYKVTGYPSQIFSLYLLRKPKEHKVEDRIHLDEKLFNLSMSTVPLEHLKTLLTRHPDKLPLITTIDLSFAYLLPDEIGLFLTQLSVLKNLKVIYYDPSDQWIDNFKKQAFSEESKTTQYEFFPQNLRDSSPDELPFYSRSINKVLHYRAAQLAVSALSKNKNYLFCKPSDLRTLSLVNKASNQAIEEIFNKGKSIVKKISPR
jgi:hypothetical protein